MKRSEEMSLTSDPSIYLGSSLNLGIMIPLRNTDLIQAKLLVHTHFIKCRFIIKKKRE